MADKAFKGLNNYSGKNQSPSANSFTDYNIQKIINNLYCTQISKSIQTGSGGKSEIYKVPVGKIFILQNCQLISQSGAPGAFGNTQIITSNNSYLTLLRGHIDYANNIRYNYSSITYPFGFLFRSNEIIYLDIDYSSSIFAEAIITGFEITDKQL